MYKYYAIIPLFCVLFLFGCAQLPDDYGLEPTSGVSVEQNHSRLQNIGVLLQSGRGFTAKQQIETINPKDLSSKQMAQYNLYYAQTLLNAGEAEQAVKYLGNTDIDELDANDKIKYYQSQAFAYSLMGNLLESAKARIGLDGFLAQPEERKKNQVLILENLGLLPDNIAHEQYQHEGLGDWVAVAKILATRQQNPDRFNAELAKWQTANPEHPANLYVGTFTKMADTMAQTPSSLAILLPQSGPYADAASAVKAGFLAAHNRDHDKPSLRFYDTEAGNPADLYRKAVKEGARLVIGPLNKESIQSLVNAVRSLTVPVLALNHVPEISRQNLYQFALSPLDDVIELMDKAALEGYKKAAVLVPNTDQGKRMANYMAQHWQTLGGTILKSLTYDPTKQDFSGIINNLSGLADSQARYGNVQKAFPAATYVPQASSGIDVLFLSASPNEGQIINAQMRQLGNIPVFALPTIYSGMPNPASDAPLNGITFCDLPWLFTGAYNGKLSMMALKDITQQFPTSYIRLVAMGIDAYNLAANIHTLNTSPFLGATGKLALEGDNRIKRNLVCAKFVKGEPELIGFSQSPSETNYNPRAKAIPY